MVARSRRAAVRCGTGIRSRCVRHDAHSSTQRCHRSSSAPRAPRRSDAGQQCDAEQDAGGSNPGDRIGCGETKEKRRNEPRRRHCQQDADTESGQHHHAHFTDHPSGSPRSLAAPGVMRMPIVLPPGNVVRHRYRHTVDQRQQKRQGAEEGAERSGSPGDRDRASARHPGALNVVNSSDADGETLAMTLFTLVISVAGGTSLRSSNVISVSGRPLCAAGEYTIPPVLSLSERNLASSTTPITSVGVRPRNLFPIGSVAPNSLCATDSLISATDGEVAVVRPGRCPCRSTRSPSSQSSSR